MIASMAAQSLADRAMGPMWSRLYPRGTHPDLGTSPNVGFRPVIPFMLAGDRIEPPVSVPMPARNRPAATPLPVPALDPAGECSRFHGLSGTAKGLVGSGEPQ